MKKLYYLLCCIFISQVITSSIDQISLAAVNSGYQNLAIFNFTSIPAQKTSNIPSTIANLIDLINYYVNTKKYNLRIQISSTWQLTNGQYSITITIENSNTKQLLNTINLKVNPIPNQSNSTMSEAQINVFIGNNIYRAQLGGYTYTIDIKNNYITINNNAMYKWKIN